MSSTLFYRFFVLVSHWIYLLGLGRAAPASSSAYTVVETSVPGPVKPAPVVEEKDRLSSILVRYFAQAERFKSQLVRFGHERGKVKTRLSLLQSEITSLQKELKTNEAELDQVKGKGGKGVGWG